MKKGLVIVESPTKARTIEGILGADFVVASTMGHVRDLPEDSFGVNLEKNFTPEYVIVPRRGKVVAYLKKLADTCPNIYLATDEDREGEAIAWHTVLAIRKNPDEAKRVAFHEITPEAVRNSFAAPRRISPDLVNAQQARRILDRIVGYTLSPFLGQHLKGLSAGRVQSVALRLLVERENEIENFQPVDYWKIAAKINKDGCVFLLNLTYLEGQKMDPLYFQDSELAARTIEKLKTGTLTVKEKTESEKRIRPFPPFVTSSLQQEAAMSLGFTSTKTMFLAQQLYEGVPGPDRRNIGLITYMRTDAPSVAKSAQFEAFKFIEKTYGKEFVPDKPPHYKARLTTAQEAHEAIRPTSINRTPETLKSYLNPQQSALYSLIWKRFLASQMKPALCKNTRVLATNDIYGFEGEHNQVLFKGFTEVWPVRIEKGIEVLPGLQPGEILPVEEYLSEKTQTKPPAYYTEASLIRALEKYGIGRPSTYAPTIAILIHRGYVKREKKSLRPRQIGRVVNEILVKFFPDVINVGFTAKMEEKLDKIAAGGLNWTEMLKEFYATFKPILDKAQARNEEVKALLNTQLADGRNCPKCGAALVLRRSRYGEFLGCSNFPKCKHVEKNEPRTPTMPSAESKTCPKCGGGLVLRKSRFGVFWGCRNFPKCKHVEKVKNADHPGH